jgi:4a-hydroxytetrahydrobiopterin dehydratase
MARRTLSADEVAQALAGLPEWAARGDRLHRKLEFAGFVEAFGFMASMALVSEAMNHHPNWSNVYNRIEIELFTHDAGGITELDVQWAKRAEALYRNRS